MPAAPQPTNTFGWMLAYANMMISFMLMFFMSLITIPLFGVFKVFISGFGQLLMIVQGLVIAGVYVIPKRRRLRYVRGIALANFLLSVILFLDMLTLRSGNLPFPAFTYPPGATGSDIPPTDQWLGFFLNLFFWMIVGLGISFKLPPKTGPAFRMRIWIAISIYLILYISGFVALMFD